MAATGSLNRSAELRQQLRQLVTPRVASLCRVEGSGVSASSSRQSALDYRAFALMHEPPQRVRRLARRLIEEHALEIGDEAGLDEFCRGLCETLAEVYENAASEN